MEPSLPEIFVRRSEDQKKADPVSPRVKREQDEKVVESKSQIQLPDIKLLESDLKMMGLDVILNDSDDSFERKIKRHFRPESQATQDVYGECLLSTGKEEKAKKTSDWLIQLDVELEKQVEQAVVAAAAVVEEEKKSKGNRCAKCNKKLGIIMIMKCHCGLIFCAQHRYAEAHDCAYDFKEEGKRILAKENPLVVGEKLPKI